MKRPKKPKTIKAEMDMKAVLTDTLVEIEPKAEVQTCKIAKTIKLGLEVWVVLCFDVEGKHILTKTFLSEERARTESMILTTGKVK